MLQSLTFYLSSFLLPSLFFFVAGARSWLEGGTERPGPSVLLQPWHAPDHLENRGYVRPVSRHIYTHRSCAAVLSGVTY